MIATEANNQAGERTQSDDGIEIGVRVKVNAHGQHEEDFSGIVTAIDEDNYLVWIKAPDGGLYGCTRAFVTRWPETNVIYITVSGGVIQDIAQIPEGYAVRVIDHDCDEREKLEDYQPSGNGAYVSDWS